LKAFQKHPLLVSAVGHDGGLAPAETFVCPLYGTPEQLTTNHARLQLFGKAKKGLGILLPIRGALDRHAIRANYQTKIWLQANKEHIHVSYIYRLLFQMAAWNWLHVGANQSSRLHDVPVSRNTCSTLQHVYVM